MKISPRYILPNLFTAASIFMGILAIFMAHRGLLYHDSKSFITACWYILFSTILDGLDGRVARITNTASKFGVEFDSLADIVAFGVAPAILLYFYVGHEYGRYGVVISGLFVVFGAIRLARFNITTNVETHSFIGLPIPSAAAILCLWILVVEYHKFDVFGILSLLHAHSYIFLILAFIISLLMVSNIRYPSFKKIEWNLKYFILLLIVLAFVVLQPSLSLCIILSVYIIYGILRWIFIVLFKILFKRKLDSHVITDNQNTISQNLILMNTTKKSMSQHEVIESGDSNKYSYQDSKDHFSTPPSLDDAKYSHVIPSNMNNDDFSQHDSMQVQSLENNKTSLITSQKNTNIKDI